MVSFPYEYHTDTNYAKLNQAFVDWLVASPFIALWRSSSWTLDQIVLKGLIMINHHSLVYIYLVSVQSVCVSVGCWRKNSPGRRSNQETLYIFYVIRYSLNMCRYYSTHSDRTYINSCFIQFYVRFVFSFIFVAFLWSIRCSEFTLHGILRQFWLWIIFAHKATKKKHLILL